ncbi:FadR/GntR family transcriptional regulator [Microcella daejeonensis]|uniref:FadR/GntR family transcriptional regulator n=1 Tax=Microcella daejeonensis TaxID=2994971 RepID=UPI00226F7C6F|nr:FadR/GntR family transcriptional regulator [Microcella daejeonensis]WAB85189.1 FadR/GntR family transcriptional regulator [Microcella daejeonensis]
MARSSLVDDVAEALLSQIVSGALPIGGALPSEAELCEKHGVSRVTVREAIKTLAAQRVVDVQRGRGTFVLPHSAWTGLEAVLRATAFGADDGRASLQLIEVRRMIETGAAALAAERRSDDELAQLEECVEGMRAAHAADDLAMFVEHDIRFHDVILRATGNVFVAVLFEPLARVMRAKREQTSAVPVIQEHAIEQHGLVLAALRSGDADAARRAMDAHMTQTAQDLEHLVLGRAGE